jgi:CheY-like chemotaxis protein
MAKILIIEDNPANMKLACLLLGKGGHSVLTAIDAEAGLAVARAGASGADPHGYPAARAWTGSPRPSS